MFKNCKFKRTSRCKNKREFLNYLLNKKELARLEEHRRLKEEEERKKQQQIEQEQKFHEKLRIEQKLKQQHRENLNSQPQVPPPPVVDYESRN